MNRIMPIRSDDIRLILQLSGHSHGGQVRLPLVGPAHLPAMARRYPNGLRRLDSLTPYTNCGLGTTFFPARFNDPSEVTSLILRRSSEF